MSVQRDRINQARINAGLTPLPETYTQGDGHVESEVNFWAPAAPEPVQHDTDVVAYNYNAEKYTPAGLVEVGIRLGWLSPAARSMNVEEVLDQAQHSFGIDRQDEHTYDSSYFPKVIFGSMIGQGTDDVDLFLDENGEYVTV